MDALLEWKQWEDESSLGDALPSANPNPNRHEQSRAYFEHQAPLRKGHDQTQIFNKEIMTLRAVIFDLDETLLDRTAISEGVPEMANGGNAEARSREPF